MDKLHPPRTNAPPIQKKKNLTVPSRTGTFAPTSMQRIKETFLWPS